MAFSIKARLLSNFFHVVITTNRATATKYGILSVTITSKQVYLATIE